MYAQQSVFELWNYTFLFMTISTLCTFMIDMIGHRTKTISSNVFGLTVLIGVTLSELFISFAPIDNLNLRLSIAIVLCIGIAIFMPLKFRTTDPEIKKRASSTGHVRNSSGDS